MWRVKQPDRMDEVREIPMYEKSNRWFRFYHYDIKGFVILFEKIGLVWNKRTCLHVKTWSDRLDYLHPRKPTFKWVISSWDSKTRWCEAKRDLFSFRERRSYKLKIAANENIPLQSFLDRFCHKV